MTSLLELTADLERRDAAVRDEIDAVAKLADGAKEVGVRIDMIRALLDDVPAERAAVDSSEAGAQERRHVAEANLTAAEALLAKHEAAGRASHDVTTAERDLGHAREAARDAQARVDHIALRHAALDESERGARAEIPKLAVRAGDIAIRLAELSRVSASGRALPEPTLDGLHAWAARVHAALLVVRGQLDVERDRLVREANELGSLVLGEQLAGSSVELVGRRMRRISSG